MRQTLFTLLSVIILASTTTVQSQNKTFENRQLLSVELLNQLIANNMEAGHISGLSACIVKHGEVVYKSNMGFANLETNEPVTDSTSFLLYSATKMFTGIGLMQLFEDGEFDLDDPINDYLPFEVVHPDHPAIPITIRMLMSHVSGITDNWSVINSLMVYNEDTPVGLSEFLENYLIPGGDYYNANSSYGSSQPGSVFSYSNVGASLCGLMIEYISGLSYSDYMETNVFQPTGMSSASFYLDEMDTTNLAHPHTFDGYVLKTLRHLSNPLIPAGFLHATNNDIANYMKMILNNGTYIENQVISGNMLDTMMTPQFTSASQTSGLLFGFDESNNVWGHTGGYNGVKTAIFFNREEDWGVSLLTNGSGEPWQILFMLYQYAHDHDFFSIDEVSIQDKNENYMIEPNEQTTIDFIVRNNTLQEYQNIEIEVTSTEENITISEVNSTIVSILPGENGPAIRIQLTAGEFNQSLSIPLKLTFSSNETIIDTATYNLYAGQADVLIVADEQHVYSSRANALQFYTNALNEIGKTWHTIDINTFCPGNALYLDNYESVIWFTGLDHEDYHTILNTEERDLIADYLDMGGKLFISSQNASEAIESDDFFANYLHSTEINGNYTASQTLTGTDNHPIFEGVEISITGGDGSNTCYSPTEIAPVDNAISVLNYGTGENCGGIIFDGNYQLVFLPFPFAAINSEIDRNDIIERIMLFFDNEQGAENMSNPLKPEFYPNPVKGKKLTINNLPSGKNIISIVNMQGQTILKEIVCKNSCTIDLQSFGSGIYILSTTNKANLWVEKIIVE